MVTCGSTKSSRVSHESLKKKLINSIYCAAASSSNGTFPNARMRLCAYHLSTQKFRALTKLCRTMEHKQACESAEKLVMKMTETESKEEAQLLQTQLGQLLNSLGDNTNPALVYEAQALITSLRVHEKYFAGHIFANRVTLGVRTTSMIEGNHSVHKRALSDGGAGITAGEHPYKLVQKMCKVSLDISVTIHNIDNSSNPNNRKRKIIIYF